MKEKTFFVFAANEKKMIFRGSIKNMMNSAILPITQTIFNIPFARGKTEKNEDILIFGKYLIAVTEKIIMVYDGKSGKFVKKFKQHKGDILKATVFDNKLYSIGNDSKVNVRNEKFEIIKSFDIGFKDFKYFVKVFVEGEFLILCNYYEKMCLSLVKEKIVQHEKYSRPLVSIKNVIFSRSYVVHVWPNAVQYTNHVIKKNVVFNATILSSQKLNRDEFAFFTNSGQFTTINCKDDSTNIIEGTQKEDFKFVYGKTFQKYMLKIYFSGSKYKLFYRTANVERFIMLLQESKNFKIISADDRFYVMGDKNIRAFFFIDYLRLPEYFPQLNDREKKIIIFLYGIFRGEMTKNMFVILLQCLRTALPQ